MGLAASQARLLSLVSRKSDLEYQGQVINSRRLQLAYKTAEIARAYSDGMNDMQIMQSQTAGNASGITNATTKEWSQLNLADMREAGFMIAGADGKYIDNMYDTDTSLPAGSTSTEVVTSEYLKDKGKTTEAPLAKTIQEGTDITYYNYNATTKQYDKMTDTAAIDILKGSLTKENLKADPVTETKVLSYTNGPKNIDLQTGLVSGKYRILTADFMKYRNGEASDKSLDAAIAAYKEKEDKSDDSCWGVDWRSDTTSTFKQKYYTENDEAVAAQYEADSAEVQAQDKRLEVELKNIETQHKAVETEYEAVKKVIDKNIETSFKTFG